MISITDRTRDILNIFGALLWVFIVIVSWIGIPGLSYIGLLAAALLSIIYFILFISLFFNCQLNLKTKNQR